MTQETNTIYIDTREKNRIKKAKTYFTKHPINNSKTETKQLQSADYAYKNIGIEFKTTTDFITSLKNGRLHKEILQMNNDYEKTYLIIAGPIHETIRKEYWRTQNRKEQTITIKSYLGAIASYNQITDVIQVETTKQAFHLIRALFEKGTDNKNRSIPTPMTKTDNTLTNFLSCIPGISSKAPVIIETLKLETLEDLLQVTIDDLTSVDGIGKKKAEKIMEWIK